MLASKFADNYLLNLGQLFAKMQRTFEGRPSGAEVRKSCRSRQELSRDSYSHQYLLVNIDFDTAENALLKVCG